MPFPIALALTIAGTALQAISEQSALKRTRRAEQAAAARQMEFSRRAQEAVQRVLPSLEPESRATAVQQAADTNTQQLVDAASAASKAAGGLPSNIQGRVSNDFLVSRANETARTTERAAQLARLLGNVRAPQLAAQDEAFQRARLATELGQINDFSRGQFGADQVGIQAAGQPNTFLATAGDALRGAGIGMLTAGPSPTSGGATPLPHPGQSIPGGVRTLRPGIPLPPRPVIKAVPLR